MKHTRLFFLLSVLIGLGMVSCSEYSPEGIDDPLAEQVITEEPELNGIYVMLDTFGGWDEPETKTNFDISTLKVTWADGDTLGFFPNQGGQVEFPVNTGGEDSSTAKFDGGG